MEPIQTTNNQIVQVPNGIKIASVILLLEGIISLLLSFLFIVSSGLSSISNGLGILLLPIIFLPFCFLVRKIKKIGLYGICFLFIAILLYFVFLITKSTDFNELILTSFLRAILIVNLPILIYLLSVRKSFI
jgi:hypothetical protein